MKAEDVTDTLELALSALSALSAVGNKSAFAAHGRRGGVPRYRKGANNRYVKSLRGVPFAWNSRIVNMWEASYNQQMGPKNSPPPRGVSDGTNRCIKRLKAR